MWPELICLLDSIHKAICLYICMRLLTNSNDNCMLKYCILPYQFKRISLILKYNELNSISSNDNFKFIVRATHIAIQKRIATNAD